METEANGQIENPSIRGTQGKQDFHSDPNSFGDTGITCAGRQSLGCDREIASGGDTALIPVTSVQDNGVSGSLSSGTLIGTSGRAKLKPETSGGILSHLAETSEQDLAAIEARKAIVRLQIQALESELELLDSMTVAKTAGRSRQDQLLANWEAKVKSLSSRNQDVSTELSVDETTADTDTNNE